MSELQGPSPEQDSKFHTYTTHYIPWLVRLMWVVFWIGLVWYLVALAVPSAKNYF
jgi:hypothetical protein